MKIKSIKSSLIFLLILCISFPSPGQQNEPRAFDLRPFYSSSGHWYRISDKSNIIDPLPDQKRYDWEQHTEIADNILLYQSNNGGWPKNYDMQAILTEKQKNKLLEVKNSTHTTFDNGTTYTQVDYLVQVYTETKEERYKEAALKGLQFILDAQYENGGWPQYFPLEKGYSRYITFNDGAFMGIMFLLKKVVDKSPDFDFVPAELKLALEVAYKKGIENILACQIRDQGKLTAWCQQHDEITLQPAWARAFEPPSICNGESAPIVEFLMNIESPDQKVIAAVQGAVKWFADSRIYNTRIEWFDAPKEKTPYTTITTDKRVVTDPAAPPIWTRYYELETERPLFCDRNSKFLYSLAEVSRERRVGYAWYTYEPQKVLNEYPAWLKQNGIETNVLEN